jgi:hypothetical protein
MRPQIFTTLALAVGASAQCPRSALQAATDSLFAAQTAGNPSLLVGLIPNTNYTESFKPIDIKTGILSSALKLDLNRSTHDTAQCATFSEFIIASSPKQYVIGTRMLFTPNASHITLIETLVTKPGDWAFNATGYLYYASRESWDPIPAAKQDTRAAIQAAGDAYFDRFANINVSVPFGTPCARLEGGASTGQRDPTGNTCSLGLPSRTVVTGRRYVADEEMGTVDIYLGFPGLDRSVASQDMPDSHLFRVEGGKIKYIHTLSTCVNAGCGLNGQGPPGRV